MAETFAAGTRETVGPGVGVGHSANAAPRARAGWFLASGQIRRWPTSRQAVRPPAGGLGASALERAQAVGPRAGRPGPTWARFGSPQEHHYPPGLRPRGGSAKIREVGTAIEVGVSRGCHLGG